MEWALGANPGGETEERKIKIIYCYLRILRDRPVETTIRRLTPKGDPAIALHSKDSCASPAPFCSVFFAPLRRKTIAHQLVRSRFLQRSPLLLDVFGNGSHGCHPDAIFWILHIFGKLLQHGKPGHLVTGVAHFMTG